MKLSLLSTAALAGLALGATACGAPADPPAAEVDRSGSSQEALDTVASFGANPGNLAMLRYVPMGMPANAPVVVVLHGCEQQAADMVGSGWDALADQLKFYVVYPQQNSTNNSAECFDWFGQFNMPSNKANITRGQGENESIKEMVDKMKADFSVDATRVYVAGFSAGGGMAAVLLATWPDVFSRGGIAAGLPYNCPAQSNSDVWNCQLQGVTLQPSDWGMRVIQADPGFTGPYPRVSIWQGTSDTTVNTKNEDALVAQWTNVHGLPQTPTATDMIAGCGASGCTHNKFADSTGQVLVDEYQVSGMPHGYAIDPTNMCGTASQYLLDEHICTAHVMATFFGLDSAAPPPPQDGGSQVDSGGPPGPDASTGGHGDAGSPGPGSGGTDAGKGGPGTPSTGGPTNGGSVGDGGADGTHAAGFAGCNVARQREPGSGWRALIGLALAASIVIRRRASTR